VFLALLSFGASNERCDVSCRAVASVNHVHSVIASRVVFVLLLMFCVVAGCDHSHAASLSLRSGARNNSSVRFEQSDV